MSDHARPWMARDADASPRSYDESYQLSGKIMLTAIVILFFVVVLMVCLHVYARWYLLRSRRRRTRRSRRGNLVFHVDPAASAAARGLNASVLRALPVFIVGKEEEEEPGECAVCLSEFAAGEAGRRLPKCGHSFHTECIDMWFHSHATCPLCRSPVEAGTSGQEARVDVADPDALCPECEGLSSASAAMTIEVPRRNFESVASPTTPFRSPMSRMLSFTRILSRDRRNGGVSPAGNCSNGNGNGSASGSAANDVLDIERGKVGSPTR